MRGLRITAALLALSYAGAAMSWAGVAMWTGRSQQVQTVTYRWVWNCEYRYNGQTFWRLFEGSCPASIQVY